MVKYAVVSIGSRAVAPFILNKGYLYEHIEEAQAVIDNNKDGLQEHYKIARVEYD